jgi:hypothetical protein
MARLNIKNLYTALSKEKRKLVNKQELKKLEVKIVNLPDGLIKIPSLFDDLELPENVVLSGNDVVKKVRGKYQNAEERGSQ